MFDTIIKKECECECNRCSDCCLCGLSGYNRSYMSGKIILENEYNRGFYEGRKSGYEMAMDNYKIRFRSMEEHEKFAQKLKDAMKPLEELKKELGI